MTNFTETLNFSSKQENSTAIKLHNRNRDFGYYYDNLCLYCANNNVSLVDISDSVFSAAAETMNDFGIADKSTDHYFFWID